MNNLQMPTDIVLGRCQALGVLQTGSGLGQPLAFHEHHAEVVQALSVVGIVVKYASIALLSSVQILHVVDINVAQQD